MVLATSQDPWAVNVVCSLQDWWKAKLYHFEAWNMVVQPDWTWFAVEAVEVEPPDYYRVILRPDTRVPEGWVWLL